MFWFVTKKTNTKQKKKDEKKKNDETFLLSRIERNSHSSVDNLHTHCNRCMLVDVGRAGRLIYFGYARCPVRMCWFDQFTVRFGFSVALGFTRIHPSAARFQLYLQRSFFFSIIRSLDFSLSLFLVFFSVYIFFRFVLTFISSLIFLSLIGVSTIKREGKRKINHFPFSL